jgi:hypothetical protein
VTEIGAEAFPNFTQKPRGTRVSAIGASIRHHRGERAIASRL